MILANKADRQRALLQAYRFMWLGPGAKLNTPQPAANPPAQAPTNRVRPARPPAKNDYSKDDSWLCRPGRQDACAVDLSTTIVAADGKLKPETWAANSNPTIDWFQLYPTFSTEPTPNTDRFPTA